MQLQENISLKSFNTFGVDVAARYFARFGSTAELSEAVSAYPKLPRMVLGGGSNILFTKNVDGLVLKNEIKKIEKVSEDDSFYYVRAGAGENWHRFVLHCIENNYQGVENLSLIPGCVGASPMQNIGAYGVEIRDVFHELKAWHVKEKCNYTFGLKDCGFGYRESVFKRKYKDEFVITHVTFKLRKTPVYNIEYGAIKEQLEKNNVKDLTARAISNAIIAIRSSKLPDPAIIGNAGSFFKNPSVPQDNFTELKQRFQEIVGYGNPDGTVKVAAGWLIEHSGPANGISWKGFRRGDAGCHEKQALVLANYGSATGQEIVNLSDEIIDSISRKYGIILEKEVNIF